MKGQNRMWLRVFLLGLGLLLLGLNVAAAGVHSLTLTGDRQVIGLSVSQGSACLTVLGNAVSFPYAQSVEPVLAVAHKWTARWPEVPEQLDRFVSGAAGTMDRLGSALAAYWEGMVRWIEEKLP
jgi:hypothetical protein